MHFSYSLKKMLPEIVYPNEIALAFFNSELERMLCLRNKTNFIPELSYYIIALEAFHKSLIALKYSIFNQCDEDIQISVKSAETVVEECGVNPKAIEDMIQTTSQAEEKIVRNVKKGFDPRIEWAETMITKAKDLQKYLASK